MLMGLQGKGSPHLCEPPKLVPVPSQAPAAVMAVPQPRAERAGGVGEGLPGGMSPRTKPPAVAQRAEAASPSSHQEILLPWVTVRTDLGRHVLRQAELGCSPTSTSGTFHPGNSCDSRDRQSTVMNRGCPRIKSYGKKLLNKAIILVLQLHQHYEALLPTAI